MKIAAALPCALLLSAGMALAQTPPPSTGTSPTPSTTPPAPATPPSATAAPPEQMAPGHSMGAPPQPNTPEPTNKAAASGNDNQAVATTGANADQPAHGANSFTRGEARRRLQSRGYSHVAGLRKDHDGVWRGTAQKDGAPVNVWLDYKGNVGQQTQ